MHRLKLCIGVVAVVAVALSIPAGAAAVGTWTTLHRAPRHHAFFGAARLTDGRIIAVGDGGSFEAASDVDLYNPSSGTWAAGAPLPSPRGAVAVAAVKGVAYAVGGHGVDGSPRAGAWRYDAAADAWHAIAPLPVRLDFAAAVSTGGFLYVVGGRTTADGTTTSTSAKLLRYSPSANTWSSLAPMPLARYGIAASADANGNIYAIGGCCNTGGHVTREVDRYSVSTNRWTRVERIPTVGDGANFGSAAVRGADGRVYVLGGGDFRFSFSTVRAYDPATDSWSYTPPMPTSAFGLAAVLDADGAIIAVGGVDNSDDECSEHPPFGACGTATYAYG